MAEAAAAPVPGRAVWSGTITFGLVSVPVELIAANRPRQLSLRMLAPDGQPLRRRYACPAHPHDRLLERDDIVRGYEHAKGEFVVVTDAQLDALAPEASREINLERFVDRAEIGPLRFERAYFLAPAGQVGRPYHLLAEAMERAGQSGIATFVMRGKEYLVAILARGGLLRGEILRFDDELRSWQDVGLPAKQRAPRKRVKAIEKAIDALAGSLRRDELTDDHAERVRALAERKLERGRDVVHAEAAPEDDGEGGEVVDLMALIRQRMGMARATAAPAGRAPTEDLEAMSKKRLYDLARDRDLPGRSTMSRDELLAALRRTG